MVSLLNGIINLSDLIKAKTILVEKYNYYLTHNKEEASYRCQEHYYESERNVITGIWTH